MKREMKGKARVDLKVNRCRIFFFFFFEGERFSKRGLKSLKIEIKG